MKLSLWSYGEFTFPFCQIHGRKKIFERRYFMGNVCPEICFLFKIFSIQTQYAGEEGYQPVSFFFSLDIPLTPIANLSSNSVSPPFKASPTSGPQLPLQCHDPITWGSLQQPPNGSSRLHFPPVHQLWAELPKTRLPSKHFSAKNYHMDPHCPQDKV